MKNWKTTLLGIIGAIGLLIGQRTAPGADPNTSTPITTGSVVTAAAVALLGLFSKDHDVTGGTR